LSNKDDYKNVIAFPTNRIVEKSTTGPKKKDQKFLDQLHKQQTKEFVETSVDEMSLSLLKSFYNMGIKTERGEFTKDLAMLVDTMRGLIYRDFNMRHAAQVLSEEMVELKVNKDGGQSARINYDIFHKGKSTRPFSKEIKEELKDGPDWLAPDEDLDK
tara:strand:- start:183 stop:656 length:474 start_codon:yes stop_codon:yes gene_type:complete